MTSIRPARVEDIPALAALRHALWPEGSAPEHAAELRSLLAGTYAPFPIVELVVEDGRGALIGFAEVSLRSYSDGCDPARPVGYLEGWFVAADRRREGIGTRLVEAAEQWARSQGCIELASDVEIDNGISHAAHRALGFEEVSRVVVYRKPLPESPAAHRRASPTDGGDRDSGGPEPAPE
jgi:aminoglycoside 6'-N-acetyltransferase I